MFVGCLLLHTLEQTVHQKFKLFITLHHISLFIIQLADFGFSKETHLEETLATYCGSALYASPEMVLCKPYIGPECDVWSLGVILYTLLTAAMPFDDTNFTKFAACLEQGQYPEPPGTSERKLLQHHLHDLCVHVCSYYSIVSNGESASIYRSILTMCQQDETEITNIFFLFPVVRDLISRMLDPNSTSRATIQEILAHPWMKTPTASTTTKRQRKLNVCYSKDYAENITQTLININRCDCACHEEDARNDRRDSVITKHCPDCDDIVANDLQSNQFLMRSGSSASSGYGSEFGSQLDLDTPGMLLPRLHNRFVERRNSTPKQSVSKSPFPHKHRNSIPSTKVYRDEDLVFV